jgi:integrase
MDAMTIPPSWADRRACRFLETPQIKGILQMIGAAYKMAIRHGLYNANPMDRVEPTHDAARELTGNHDEDDGATPDRVLASHEIGQMLLCAEPGFWRTLLTTLALTGMRSGEAFALRWGDCELGGNEPKVSVKRTLSWARLKGDEIKPRFYPPKTKAGLRTIEIPTELAVILKRWKLQCPLSGDDLVFPAADGRPTRRSVALRRGLWPALRRAGLRRVNMHSLRHSFASALIAKGAPITQVQSVLGHSSPIVTLHVYSHWFRATRTTAIETVAREMLSGDFGKPEKSGHKVGTENPMGEPLKVVAPSLKVA